MSFDNNINMLGLYFMHLLFPYWWCPHRLYMSRCCISIHSKTDWHRWMLSSQQISSSVVCHKPASAWQQHCNARQTTVAAHMKSKKLPPFTFVGQQRTALWRTSASREWTVSLYHKPSKHKTCVKHLYNVGPTSSTLIQHCINNIHMLYKC